MKRRLVLRYEIKRFILKSLNRNAFAPTASRYVSSFYLLKLGKINAKSTVKNRCIISGRAKAIDKYTALSRFSHRRLSYEAVIPGLRRASW